MTNQEYVDIYGKNLEDALKIYHDEHNEYPNDYTTLELPKLDKEVSCEVSINYDGTVYLNNCKVDNEEVVDDNNEIYVYGKYVPSYIIGDVITYKDINFYAIENSDTMKDYVTMLKAEPLTVDEVNLYGGVGTEDNHVNISTSSSMGVAKDNNGYGGVAFYTSSTCGLNGSNCVRDYMYSDIKYIVDNWSNNKLGDNDLYVDEDGYSSRLIKIEELRNNLGYGETDQANLNVNSWVYDYNYWTMSRKASINFWVVNSNGNLIEGNKYMGGKYTVRPVVILKKSALE